MIEGAAAHGIPNYLQDIEGAPGWLKLVARCRMIVIPFTAQLQRNEVGDIILHSRYVAPKVPPVLRVPFHGWTNEDASPRFIFPIPSS